MTQSVNVAAFDVQLHNNGKRDATSSRGDLFRTMTRLMPSTDRPSEAAEPGRTDLVPSIAFYTRQICRQCLDLHDGAHQRTPVAQRSDPYTVFGFLRKNQAQFMRIKQRIRTLTIKRWIPRNLHRH